VVSIPLAHGDQFRGSATVLAPAEGCGSSAEANVSPRFGLLPGLLLTLWSPRLASSRPFCLMASNGSAANQQRYTSSKHGPSRLPFAHQGAHSFGLA
jgi:hypothetical protein